ncbi:hypothetical protein BTO30_15330 [Domibacillus antri]|uniref:IDEAL domain-containing protein n=1 Tax=Domibacillus antri TaxID=1714264 RepID=A0A1Q8Q233_9BACI|nr:IDEAL domain-containing protein [Domibacillus antri]OLN21368.1 hypothetical protein BTO30_15330 [Domibacillus antri]
MNLTHHFEVGDWVKATTREGELVQGYIVNVDPLHDIMKVHVVDSDNESKVGKTIRLFNKWAAKLSILTAAREEQLLQLIDLALLTRDEQWFMDLSAALNSLQGTSESEKPCDNFYPNIMPESETRRSNR